MSVMESPGATGPHFSRSDSPSLASGVDMTGEFLVVATHKCLLLLSWKEEGENSKCSYFSSWLFWSVGEIVFSSLLRPSLKFLS